MDGVPTNLVDYEEQAKQRGLHILRQLLLALGLYWVLSYIVKFRHYNLVFFYPLSPSSCQPSMASPIYNIYNFIIGSGCFAAVTPITNPTELIWTVLDTFLLFIPLSLALSITAGYWKYRKIGGRDPIQAWLGFIGSYIKQHGWRFLFNQTQQNIHAYEASEDRVDTEVLMDKDRQMIGLFVVVFMVIQFHNSFLGGFFLLDLIVMGGLIIGVIGITRYFYVDNQREYGRNQIPLPQIWHWFLAINFISTSFYLIPLLPVAIQGISFLITIGNIYYFFYVMHFGLIVIPAFGHLIAGLWLITDFKRGQWVAAWWIITQYVLVHWVYYYLPWFSWLLLIAAYLVLKHANHMTVPPTHLQLFYYLLVLLTILLPA